MPFQVLPISATPFQPLYGLSDQALARRGAMAVTADAKPGYPCRVSLRDAEPGERLILLNYEHLPVDTPYRSRHAIFVRDGARPARPDPDSVPDCLASRLLSVRAFDAVHMMVEADLAEGHDDASALFRRMLRDDRVAYLHVHTARRGCYLARVVRA